MSRHHVGLNLHQIIAHAKSMKNIKENQTHSTAVDPAVDPADPAQELRGLEGQAVAAEHGEGRMKPGCDATRCNAMQHDATRCSSILQQEKPKESLGSPLLSSLLDSWHSHGRHEGVIFMLIHVGSCISHVDSCEVISFPSLSFLKLT